MTTTPRPPKGHPVTGTDLVPYTNPPRPWRIVFVDEYAFARPYRARWPAAALASVPVLTLAERFASRAATTTEGTP